jgi:dephospho-CoA kinase
MRTKKIALTGGIATGKSTVASQFRELGAIILDADEYARRVVEPGTSSRDALQELIGASYFNPDGTLKRRELREKIIEDPPLRQKLDALLHPYILQAMWQEWEKQRALYPEALIICDIPLLFEGGFHRNFDLVILVYSSPTIQAQRLSERDRITLEEARQTLRMQFPIDSKKALSHYVIDNSGSIEQTLLQVEHIWKKLLK